MNMSTTWYYLITKPLDMQERMVTCCQGNRVYQGSMAIIRAGVTVETSGVQNNVTLYNLHLRCGHNKNFPLGIRPAALSPNRRAPAAHSRVAHKIAGHLRRERLELLL